MANNKMTKDTIPDEFTLTLALVDAIPVVFFGLSCVRIGQLFHSVLFLVGAIACLAGGMGKVLWKIIVAIWKKNVWPLFIQMRIVMPLGFALMLISVGMGYRQIDFAKVSEICLRPPAVFFFLVGILGMILMTVFAVKLDSSDSRSNWIEQTTNGIAQFCIYMGLLFL